MANKLLELLAYEGARLSSEFEKAGVAGRNTPQEVADFRENALRDFVRRYFPFPYRVAKGNIVDSFGNESDSIDCVLLNPIHPHTIDSFDKFTVILADAVDAAIELKPNLQDKAELERGLRQIVSVKQLRRSKTPLLLSSNLPPHILEHSLRVPAFLFAERCKSDPTDTAREIAAFYHRERIELEDQVDFVIVNGLGIISNYKHPERALGGQGAGVFWEEWAELTTAAVLLKLNWVYPASPMIVEATLPRYLKAILPKRFCRIQ